MISIDQSWKTLIITSFLNLRLESKQNKQQLKLRRNHYQKTPNYCHCFNFKLAWLWWTIFEFATVEGSLACFRVMQSLGLILLP